MTFQKVEIHGRNLEVRKKALKEEWNIQEETKKDLLKFLEELELGKVNNGNKISEVRQLKYLDMLKIPLEYFNKPISQLTTKDMEKFDKNLTSNELLSKKNKPFEHNTKSDIKSLLKIFLKWKLGDNDKFKSLAGWLDTKQKKKTPEYLTEQQVEKLLKSCKSAKERYLIAILFDSGARAEEFFNIRYEDVEMPKDSNNFVKITLKEEYSKTQGRVISLFWDKSLEAVRDFLREREQEGIKSNEQVFKDTYDNARMFLARLGQKVLSRRVYFHLFRHSSATFYAPKINRQQLCYRYGWKFSSDMVDVYISRAGMNEKDIEEKFTGTKVEELQKEIEKQKQDLALMKEMLKTTLEAGIPTLKKVKEKLSS